MLKKSVVAQAVSQPSAGTLMPTEQVSPTTMTPFDGEHLAAGTQEVLVAGVE
jgi:hypothetical protein